MYVNWAEQTRAIKIELFCYCARFRTRIQIFSAQILSIIDCTGRDITIIEWNSNGGDIKMILERERERDEILRIKFKTKR